MKFKGYVRCDEDYKNANEGHGPILLQFYGKCLVILIDKDLDNDEIFIEHPKRKHKYTQLGFCPNSKWFKVGMMK